MATQEQLDDAAQDALALTQFMTAAARTDVRNSAGAAIGTLADLPAGGGGAPVYDDVTALASSTESLSDGTAISTLREGAGWRVVDDTVAPHLITAGGMRLQHVAGPYVIAISGQSNAQGAFPDGPNPASPLVQVWDGAVEVWGSSDRTQPPFSRATPHGNGGNNNYALARAHRIVADTGRPVLIIYDAAGGRPLADWVDEGTASERYAALSTKVTAALATPILAEAGITGIDELIFAQGEADFETDFPTYLARLRTFREQLRAEPWCNHEVPIYFMGPSNLHDRYWWREALLQFCAQDDSRCIHVPSEGMRTEYSTTGAGDNTHFLGESLWEAGYWRIAAAAPTVESPRLFLARGAGPATPEEPTVLATFSNLVSRDSWTDTSPPDGPAATGSISWGHECNADGNYSAAFGYQCVIGNSSNYGLVAGRLVEARASADYFGGFGYQIGLEASYSFGAGRGHVVADQGGAAFGLFSEYTAPESDPVALQVGTGSSSSNRSNGLTVRKSGVVEMKGLPVHADDTAALGAGLSVGCLYRTADGDVRVVV
ncbi:MAG: sialate O-acetylesterase [Pseudomonadota bacterium]